MDTNMWATSEIQEATMNSIMSITWTLDLMMINLPKKSVKAFAGLQITCRGQSGKVHLCPVLIQNYCSYELG
jgi:hypothetical protein